LCEKYDIFCAAPINDPYGSEWIKKLGENKFFEIPYRAFRIRQLLRLISFIKKNQIEILHAHGKGAGIYGRLIKLLYYKVYVVFTFHGFHSAKYNPLAKKLYVILERLLSRLTDQFINVSKGEQDVCISNGIYKKYKSVVIHNALEHVELANNDKIQLREKLSLPKDKFIILSAARFNEQKNIPDTITIAKKLQEHAEIFFTIIGDGEQKKGIERQIIINGLTNILLTGYRRNVHEYMVASDIYLSTSIWEGLPYSLIEAIRAGLPIIASNVTGNNEIVVSGYNGILFKLSDYDAAVKSILEIKSSIKKQQMFCKNSKNLFNEKFKLDGMIEKMKNVYNRSIERDQNKY
jgi:glycosyltransferase involved in cell wall biosynthesis